MSDRPSRDEQVRQVVDDALTRPPEARAVYLAKVCGGDPELQHEVEQLMAALAASASFSSTPVVGVGRGGSALSPGTRLGPYQIESTIGSGGMGDVYKARDTRLNRIVAIKILPQALAKDSQFRKRFDREARAIAALTHPHICALYDIGQQDGTAYLVMEHLEGETLDDRLKNGALSVDQALRYAIEIAAALDAAHRAGIVHRDVKPGNVMLTTIGAKLLDFGLAKATVPVENAGRSSMLPTTAVVTAQGSLLGTLQYMAPERLEGHEADIRTDIFAFGAVLYEMLTGRKAFEGNSHAALIAAILNTEPVSMAASQPLVPPALVRVVNKCLRKAPSERWQSAKDLHDELQWIAEPGSQADAPRRTTASRRLWPLWILSLVLALVAAVASWGWWRATRPVEQPLIQLDVDVGSDVAIPAAARSVRSGSPVIISPDGSRLVYLASVAGGSSQLFTRRLDRREAAGLPGTEGAELPFFSPDGQWVGFAAGGRLNKISVDGGAAVSLGVVPDFAGASWSEDGTIIAASIRQGLTRIPSRGGEPTLLMEPTTDEPLTAGPHILPNSKAVLFVATGRLDVDKTNIEVVSLGDRRRKILMRGATGPVCYLSSGHLVYSRNGTVFAIPFDPDRLEAYGTAVPVVDGVAYGGLNSPAAFDVSRTGTLVYRRGSGGGPEMMTVQWIDRMGDKKPLLGRPGVYRNPRFSPDGTRLLLGIREERTDQFAIYDWQRDTLTRLTFGDTVFDAAVWSPDGRNIVLGGNRGMFWTRADGGSQPQPLTESTHGQFPSSFTPDGKRLAYTETTAGPPFQIWTVPIENNGGQLRAGRPEPFLKSTFDEILPTFSPDGRWLAYASTESGRFEVYVRPFPGPSSGSGSRWPISDSGGTVPFWSRTTNQLLYRAGDQIMAVPYSVKGDFFVAEKPRIWVAHLGGTKDQAAQDLAPDDTRFAVLTPVQMPNPTKVDHDVVIVLNFLSELRRRVPVGR
jgi:serine/threonine protein kinase/Tol biopolymer transport system component